MRPPKAYVFVVAFAASQWLGLMGLWGGLPRTGALGTAGHVLLMPGYLVASALSEATLWRTGISDQMLSLLLVATALVVNLCVWLLGRAIIRRIVATRKKAR